MLAPPLAAYTYALPAPSEGASRDPLLLEWPRTWKVLDRLIRGKGEANCVQSLVILLVYCGC